MHRIADHIEIKNIQHALITINQGQKYFFVTLGVCHMRENKPRLIPFSSLLLCFFIFGGATNHEREKRKEKQKKVIAIVHQSKCTCNYERHEKLRLTVK